MKETGEIKLVTFAETLQSAKLTKAKPSTAHVRMVFFGLILCGSVTGLAIAAEGTPFFVVATDLSPTPLKYLPHVKIPTTAIIPAKRANFNQEIVSKVSRYVSDWIVDSNDNQQMPFVVVDKKAARVFVFDPQGKLIGSSPALLGLAVGDNAIPDIGNMSLANITPEQRTTPAGRFVANLGRNLKGKEILWVDYNGAISLHRVVTTSAKERRLQRLESKDPLERRISYGCINVPVDFYDRIISPTFTGTSGVVYVLPDTRLAQEVFGSYDVDVDVKDRIAK